MKISVFGLGYVGAVTAGCLAEQGHQIIGVDVHAQKVADFNRGQAPIIEPGLDALLYQAYGKGLLHATDNVAEALAASEVSLICVGTPSRHDGAIDLTHVQEVSRQIAEALMASSKSHVLIYRSTMLPGSTETLVDNYLGKAISSGQVEVIYFPEFLREGTAIADFRQPSMVVLGTREGKPPSQGAMAFFGEANVLNWRTAELVKYASNAFHAAKVVFANEIGRIGKQLDVDAQAVMSLLCKDTRLNLSPYYLRPGNPFGGSCLPKDVRALSHMARQQGLNLPLIENLLASNGQHLNNLLQLIARRGQKEAVILGLSYKPNTDDLRESAMVEVAQTLLGHRYQLRIYDPQLNLARLIGSNRRVLDVKMPHLASLLHEDLASALGTKGLVLAAQRCASIQEMSKHITAEHHIIDINGWPELRALSASYEGFCW